MASDYLTVMPSANQKPRQNIALSDSDYESKICKKRISLDSSDMSS